MTASPSSTPAAPDGPARREAILLVTGTSGAGKTTALRTLEDLGWEAIDNVPIRLLDRLIGKGEQVPAPLAIGIDTRTRGFDPRTIVSLVEEMSGPASAPGGLPVNMMFIDCASSELERRYNETRRRHPMARGRPVLDGIMAERELLEPLRRRAEVVIDTTSLTAPQLQLIIRDQFDNGTSPQMVITVSSFGFARGMPPLADLVFDMRFLDNPHWQDDLRDKTGLDDPVRQHIQRDPGFEPAMKRITDLLLFLLPRYGSEGRSYLNIAFACTGGRHRSVFAAEYAAQVLRDAEFSLTVRHRDLTTRAAEELEKPRRKTSR